MPRLVRHRDQPRKRLRCIIVPVGLAGLATRTPESCLRLCSASSASGVSAQRVVAAGFDQHRLAAQRVQDMPVRRIARIGERDTVAGFEQRQKGQNKSGRRAGGDDDPRRIERNAVGVA